MDFANEPYVRLYTRDTPGWTLLAWEARAVLPLLMRKVDRAGTLDFPTRHPAARIVAKVIDVPIEVVEVGLADLADAGVIDITPGKLVIGRFIEGQSTPASPAERKRRMRARNAAYRNRGHITDGFGEVDEPKSPQHVHKVQDPDLRSTIVTTITSSSQHEPEFSNPANNWGTPGNAESRLTEPTQYWGDSSGDDPSDHRPMKAAELRRDPPAIATAPAPIEIDKKIEIAKAAAATKTEGSYRSPSAPANTQASPTPANTQPPAIPFIAHAWVADFRVRWCQLIDDLETDVGRKLYPPLPWAGPDKIMGLQAALTEYGPDAVAEVLLFALGQWARTDPNDLAGWQRATAFLARTFVGDGFSAAHARWAQFEARWQIATRGRNSSAVAGVH